MSTNSFRWLILGHPQLMTLPFPAQSIAVTLVVTLSMQPGHFSESQSPLFLILSYCREYERRGYLLGYPYFPARERTASLSLSLALSLSLLNTPEEVIQSSLIYPEKLSGTLTLPWNCGRKDVTTAPISHLSSSTPTGQVIR